jgi:hypothetical protein
MMARSTTCSNQRPDTLMQDRSPLSQRRLLQRTAGPYIRVIFDRDEGSSKPRHVGCAPESGSGMRKQQRLRDLDRSLRQAQPKVESIRVEMRAVRGLE